MAPSRTINSPGIEIRTVDRSLYNNNTTNYSLPNSPVVFMTGFADRGVDCIPQWINTKQKLADTFGNPTNEFEKYLYNGCIDVLNRGGVCIASKLPYDNNQSKKYAYSEYSVNGSQLIQEPDVMNLDNYLTSCVEIKSDVTHGYITNEQFDDLKVSKSILAKNKIRFIDINKNKYTTTSDTFNSVTTIVNYNITENEESLTVSTNDCLGVFPVIVTPVNAMYYQNLISHGTTEAEKSAQLNKYQPINNLSSIASSSNIKVDLRELTSNLLIPLKSDSDDLEETMSKIVSDKFPLLSYRDSKHLDTQYLKQIGVVVVNAFIDRANSNKVNFNVLESFVGSLDRTDIDNVSKASIYIDNVVNSQSRYINMFSNVDQRILKTASTIYIAQQNAKMLGFYEYDCAKKVDTSTSIFKPLTNIFEYIKDPNQYQIDLILDAGVSTIAQYIYTKFESAENSEIYIPFKTVYDWKLNNNVVWTIKHGCAKWRQVLKKFDDYCKYVRKDCMFLADAIRTFALNAEQKIVRPSKIESTVDQDILVNLKELQAINSSYSAGYCNWFQIVDAFTKTDLIWCPPSIKAVNAYILCDTYYHTWDAPAGMIRGVVPNVIDVAFSPTKDEAGKIYLQSWNYAINYPLDGIVIEGQKTFQTQKTALDRVNVRRLTLSLERKISNVAKYFLYEGNTAYLRQRFADEIKTILEQAKNGNGISDYAIKCDNDINTIETIENNELHCKVAIKPIKTIEFIVLDFIVTSQAANVSEEVIQ